MALEFQKNGLAPVKGRFYYDNAFDIQDDELLKFEMNFPYKEKLETETQLKH